MTPIEQGSILKGVTCTMESGYAGSAAGKYIAVKVTLTPAGRCALYDDLNRRGFDVVLCRTGEVALMDTAEPPFQTLEAAYLWAVERGGEG